MPSYKATIVAFVGLLNLAVPQVIDPNSVSIGTRQVWCTNQQASCPLLCDQYPDVQGQPTANTCDPVSLAYTCVCSNGISPNASQYSQTIPYFECTESANQCAANCNGSNTCVTSCRTAHPCGAQDPVRVNLSTVTTSTMVSTAAGSTATGSASLTGSSSTQTSVFGTTPSPSNAFTIHTGQTLGFAVVLAGFIAGFAVML